MPSFDIVSQVDWHEVDNALDQANREIHNRYDFKNSDARVERTESALTLHADDEFKLGQARDILYTRLSKRGVDLGALDAAEVELTGQRARQRINVRSGVDTETAREIVKLIKSRKTKVQAAVQGEQVRVTGKKRDDLQAIITAVKEHELDLPLQFTNFRD